MTAPRRVRTCRGVVSIPGPLTARSARRSRPKPASVNQPFASVRTAGARVGYGAVNRLEKLIGRIFSSSPFKSAPGRRVATSHVSSEPSRPSHKLIACTSADDGPPFRIKDTTMNRHIVGGQLQHVAPIFRMPAGRLMLLGDKTACRLELDRLPAGRTIARLCRHDHGREPPATPPVGSRKVPFVTREFKPAFAVGHGQSRNWACRRGGVPIIETDLGRRRPVFRDRRPRYRCR